MAARTFDKKREINGVLYLAAAIILAVAFYLPSGRGGWLGQILQSAGRGLFGSAALVLPVLFVYMAFDYLLEKELTITRRRFTYVLILLIGTAALLHLLTTDLQAIRTYSLLNEGKYQAWRALERLWQSGIDPTLVEAGKHSLSGGLLGGGLGLALHAIAGPIGSLVLLGALLLSLVILLFNVSLSGMFGQTAKALQTTREKMDHAMRDHVDQVRETRQTEVPDRKSYDLLLKPNETGVKAAEPDDKPGDAETVTGQKKPTLLESLKRLFQPDDVEDGLSGLPEEDLSVPSFLQDAKDEAASENPPADIPVQTGMTRQSPFDIEVKGAAAAESPVVLPAGIHRVVTGVATQTEASEQDESLSAAPAAGSGGEVIAGSRENWTDRSEPIAPTVNILQSGRRIPGKAGTQMSIELPYQAPPLRLLRDESTTPNRVSSQSVNALGVKLEKTLESFGIQASVVHYTTGPTITRFELSPGPGVKVSRIVSLADDIALNLAALGVRIEAPIPGKSAIGIEIPNKETQPVLLRGLLESPEFQNTRSPLTAALGRDIQGYPILCDLAKMPHLLIAGATGSGKSVCINAILMSILYRSSPDDVRMLMIDPKVVELSVYNGIPHLLSPVVTDPKKAANTLTWAVSEMIRRYGLFAEKSVRDITSYQASAAANAAAVTTDNDEAEYEHLPLILLVIDELSDLMATTPTEVEDAIARLTAMARAAGIHLIIATQRPSVDVITGVIKANIPSRIAFAVASQVDSRTILDMAGAEKLLGKGDMLYYPQSIAKPVRGQGAFITDSEVEQVLNYIKAQHAADYDDAVSDAIMTAQASSSKDKISEGNDELLPQALDIVVETGYASVSLLQRRMNVGYPRAARLIDTLHDKGYIGPFDGSKPRKLLITQTQYMELKAKENS
ncbi:MAG: DNA translocase FtsK [Bacillota bacterium]|nr:DNA translocase FtsK [Bacillota bacterium]